MYHIICILALNINHSSATVLARVPVFRESLQQYGEVVEGVWSELCWTLEKSSDCLNTALTRTLSNCRKGEGGRKGGREK